MKQSLKALIITIVFSYCVAQLFLMLFPDLGEKKSEEPVSRSNVVVFEQDVLMPGEEMSIGVQVQIDPTPTTFANAVSLSVDSIDAVPIAFTEQGRLLYTCPDCPKKFCKNFSCTIEAPCGYVYDKERLGGSLKCDEIQAVLKCECDK